jgi:hypothetical protein
VSLIDIAQRFGTPCYVYSRAALTDAYYQFADALKGREHLICYAVKANPNLAILNLFARLGDKKSLFAGLPNFGRFCDSAQNRRQIQLSRVIKSTFWPSVNLKSLTNPDCATPSPYFCRKISARRPSPDRQLPHGPIQFTVTCGSS